MGSIAVKIKHAGKSYDVSIDPSASGLVFKHQIHELTGVDPAKVKVPVKGGMLKDDADMSKLGLKAGQTLMVIGAAGPIPTAPTEKIVFMEDMTDTQLAEAVAFPVGLANLGNTCYMNSSIQVLRAIPELQVALNNFADSRASSGVDASMTSSLRELYKDMKATSEPFPPVMFLQTLRAVAPQFAERARNSNMYAQQDAQEAWGAIMNALNNNLDKGAGGKPGKFVEQYMTGQMETTLRTAEAPDEAPTTRREGFRDIKCNISASTNYMMSGVSESLDQQIEKHSSSLGRSAVYDEKSRIARLPAYLTVNMVRFFWRREINKKTKIMRKVKFPFDLDVVDLLTDELKAKILPVNAKLKQVDKDRRERAKIRARAKIAQEQKKEVDAAAAATSTGALEGAASASTSAAEASAEAPMVVDGEEKKAPQAGELVDEETTRAGEAKMLRDLIDPSLANDVGSNVTGMFELVAIVTHKGASADGGHYVGWAKVPRPEGAKVDEQRDPDKEPWLKFDDEKVSEVTRDKIASLDGGGEDHSAYILLYASKQIE